MLGCCLVDTSPIAKSPRRVLDEVLVIDSLKRHFFSAAREECND